jgi:hypothetical protein
MAIGCHLKHLAYFWPHAISINETENRCPEAAHMSVKFLFV